MIARLEKRCAASAASLESLSLGVSKILHRLFDHQNLVVSIYSEPGGLIIRGENWDREKLSRPQYHSRRAASNAGYYSLITGSSAHIAISL